MLSSIASIWVGDAVSKHILVVGECLDMFKVYIMGRQIMEEDRMVFPTFAMVWNLLNILRAVCSGHAVIAVQLHGDVTFKAPKAALNEFGFSVNLLGNNFAPVTRCRTVTYKPI